MPQLLLPFLLLIHLMASTMMGAETPASISPEQEKYFETKIRPVLANHCYECHGAKKQQAGLRVDHKKFLLKGGDTGSVLTPGKLEESRLWAVLLHDPLDTQMPPDSKLPEAVLSDLKRWIEMGAPWPVSDQPEVTTAEASHQWKSHWAFQPLVDNVAPKVKNSQWANHPIDQFVLLRLQKNGLTPSPTANRATLLRRLKYDLLGLPPDAEELQAFVNDREPEAYRRVVDRYLSSPQFGERWARYWLDVARYADTKGYVFQEDRNYPDAWRYREWVIEAFNQDLPYDQFLVRQLAADQSSEDPQDLHAMGFLTLGRRFLNNSHDIIDDRIDVVSRGLMGLTVTCARCHDHKYDPIPTNDYYSLYGVFASSHEPKDDPSTLRMIDKEKPFQPVVFLRGSPGNRGDRVPRQFLGLLAGEDRKPFQQGSGRLEMARAIASADNPLTARVWSNRVWGHLIGAPLVRTPSDFGLRSDPPTHSELLDWLASSLIRSGWSTKSLIREIVLSSTYRQQSAASVEISSRDPENALLSHMNRRRVDFESLRDGLLAVANRLDLKVGGPSVEITTQPFSHRRTVYAFVDRQNLPNMFRTFDFAGPDTHSPQRYETNVPQQALFLLNSPFVMEQAETIAGQLTEADPEARIRHLYRQILVREPTSHETTVSRQFIENSVSHPVSSGLSPWQYGYGELEADKGTLNGFTKLPHFSGKEWQGGAKLPDPQLGWVMLNERGGHVGNDLKHVAVRRWRIPFDGRLVVTGKLKHPAEQGDGIRGRILLEGAQPLGLWHVHHKETATNIKPFAVKVGQTLDFVTDLNETIMHDSFEWVVQLRLERSDRAGQLTANSVTDFRGPSPRPLDPWSQLAQVLLLSNEFQFID